MSQRSEAFKDAWGRFCTAFESGDDEASLSALQEWIISWDDCVQVEETENFGVAYHDDVVALNRLPLPGARDTRGLEEYRTQLQEVPDVANRFRFEIAEFERSEDRFMGSGRFRARGRYSGLVMRFPLAVVWDYDDGRIRRVQAFGTRRRARAELLATEAVR